MIETNAAENFGAILVLCGTILILALLLRPILAALVEANRNLAESNHKAADAQQEANLVQRESINALRALKDGVKDMVTDIRAQVNTAQIATKSVMLDVQDHLDGVAHREAQAAASTVVAAINSGFGTMQASMSAGFTGVEQKLEQIKTDLVNHKNASKAGEDSMIMRLDSVLNEVRALKKEAASQDSPPPAAGA